MYESARKYTEIGAGVGLLKRPWQVLKRLGLANDLAKCAHIPQDEDEPSLHFLPSSLFHFILLTASRKNSYSTCANPIRRKAYGITRCLSPVRSSRRWGVKFASSS